jgi:uncharacterized membrane protein YphA (DoxX/SURF4 family)
MKTNSATFPSQPTAFSTHASHRSALKSWRPKAIGALRVAFGLVWAVAAWLKWQPDFQNHFLDQVSAAKDGQPSLVQGWIVFWMHVVSTNPLLFARVEASLETALAVFLVLGIFSNLTFIIGFFLSLGIWSTAEGFGGPYQPGQSTDIGTAFPYAIIFAILFCVSAGYYYGLDRWLTPRLGRLGFLATHAFKEAEIGR